MTISKQRLQNYFNWQPISQPSGLKNPKKPLLWLASKCKEGGQNRELYFVNDLDEPLDCVSTEQGGFISDEDNACGVASNRLDYQNVQPGEAVKVAEYDDYYDLDYVLNVSIFYTRNGWEYELTSPPEKGGPTQVVLLWDDGSLGKYCRRRVVWKYADSLIEQMRRLWLQWDPIDVIDMDEEDFHDEYDAYLEDTLALVLNASDIKPLIAYLNDVVFERMELSDLTEYTNSTDQFALLVWNRFKDLH